MLFARERLGFEADPVQQRVLDSGIRRGILNCRRQWGKSTVTAIKAVHRAYFDPGCLVMAVSPSGRQSAEFVRKCAGLSAEAGDPAARGTETTRFRWRCRTDRGWSGCRGRRGRRAGFTAPAMVIIDEASRVPDELYLAMRPMLVSGDGDLWLMSTPCGQARVLLRGVGGRRSDVDAGGGAGDGGSADAAGGAGGRAAAMGDAWFRQEYLCEFVQADDAVFREEDVYACLRDDVPPLFPEDVAVTFGGDGQVRPELLTAQARYFVGLDLGKAQDYTAVAVIERAELLWREERDPVTWQPRREMGHFLRLLAAGAAAYSVSGCGGVCAGVSKCSGAGGAVDAGGGCDGGGGSGGGSAAAGIAAVFGGAGDDHGRRRGVGDGDVCRAPKRDLIVGLQVAMQKRWLEVARGDAMVRSS